MSDLIDRQVAIEALADMHCKSDEDGYVWIIRSDAWARIDALPSVQPEKRTEERTETHACDLIDREAAIDAFDGVKVDEENCTEYDIGYNDGIDFAVSIISVLPSAQPERTCVNCGRTINNGGWYADGGTRCPIEEHYALPKDGYCHLWEKRNVTDDDYPERRTDE